MLIIDHFYLCEKRFPQGLLILKSVFDHLVSRVTDTQSQRDCLTRQRSVWMLWEVEDLTVVTTPRDPSCRLLARMTP